MKKATSITFENILTTIHQKGITTKAALMVDQQLYANFWIAAQDFATFCLFSKNGKTTKTGKQLSGNKTKVDILEAHGITTREDITMDCVVRMVEYVENMLQKPTVAYMKNYAYSIVNSAVNTIFRTLPPDDIKIVSLNNTIDGTNVDAEDAYTYEDCTPDFTYAPDRVFSEKEIIKELEMVLQAKRAKELTEKREAILREVALLSKRPAEVMVRLACTHLSMKPRELASLIIDKSCELAYAEIIFEVAKQNHIELSEISSIIAGHKLKIESVKADTNSAEQVAGQISRLVYRAEKRLSK